ncbi:MAG: endo-1,4-beta-xylanase [Ignavibacteria bacterium GWB2_35_6b]|nr:MAG: endo-1,4-beta-xylanase [Ignavibacteria bacterium GWB2_35_6b]
MKTLKTCFALLILLSLNITAQEIINLYQDTVPNSKESGVKEKEHSGMFSGVTKPTLEIYLPKKENSTGAAVVICPGGGYAVVVYQAEGIKTAKEFAEKGVAAFVLKYRLPDDSTMMDKKIGPLQDAQQAIKVVRENSAKWGIDINRIGIMGFSAGGHLASTAATHYEKAIIENNNNTNLRPDFQILIYPVISMLDSLTHLDSRKNLLGENPSEEIIAHFSNELQVNTNTPPAYITHTGDDIVVDVDNSINYYERLRHYDVPAEMHIYPKGNHGFVLSQPSDEWMKPIFTWMKKSKWIDN